MKILKLERFCHSDYSTDGRLWVDDEFICWTTERPWRNNQPGVSCVPSGNYLIEPYTRKSGENAFILLGLTCGTYEDFTRGKVPRWGILIHAGNVAATDSQGCILPGLAYEPGRVNNSRAAMRKLRKALAPATSLREGIWLEISFLIDPTHD